MVIVPVRVDERADRLIGQRTDNRDDLARLTRHARGGDDHYVFLIDDDDGVAVAGLFVGMLRAQHRVHAVGDSGDLDLGIETGRRFGGRAYGCREQERTERENERDLRHSDSFRRRDVKPGQRLMARPPFPGFRPPWTAERRIRGDVTSALKSPLSYSDERHSVLFARAASLWSVDAFAPSPPLRERFVRGRGSVDELRSPRSVPGVDRRKSSKLLRSLRGER